MKISQIVLFILLIGAVFLVFANLGDELNQQYPSNSPINTSFRNEYQYSGTVNVTVGKLVNSFSKIADPEAGFFTKIGSGIVAIPYALILFVSATFDTISLGANVITGIGIALYLSSGLIFILITMLIVYIIFKLVEFYQRAPA